MAGPTASGKTDLAIKLAQEFNGEIINADSRQIYSGLDVGTNKGLLTTTNYHSFINGTDLQGFELEKSGVIGWLFSFLKPNEVFDVNQFQDYTNQLIEIITASGKLPIICGGTGLYIDALVKGYKLNSTKPNLEIREQLNKLDTPTLFAKLTELDKEKALSLNNSDKHNPHRLIRAIEVAMDKESEVKQENAEVVNEYLILYPKFEKEDLYAKIDKRVPEMFAEGMVTETKIAIENGYADTEVLNGIGYKEVQQMLNNKIDEQTAIDLTAQAHRNYAKRQITWFEGKGRAYDLNRFDFKKRYIQICDKIADFLNE